MFLHHLPMAQEWLVHLRNICNCELQQITWITFANTGFCTFILYLLHTTTFQKKQYGRKAFEAANNYSDRWRCFVICYMPDMAVSIPVWWNILHVEIRSNADWLPVIVLDKLRGLVSYVWVAHLALQASNLWVYFCLFGCSHMVSMSVHLSVCVCVYVLMYTWMFLRMHNR